MGNAKKEAGLSSKGLRLEHQGGVRGLWVVLGVKAELDALRNDPNKQEDMGRLESVWQRACDLPIERGRSHVQAEQRIDGVQIYRFGVGQSTGAIRLYFVMGDVEGNPAFVATSMDPNKRQQRADPKKLKQAAEVFLGLKS